MMRKLLKGQCECLIILIAKQATFGQKAQDHTFATHYYFKSTDLAFLKVCFLMLFLGELPPLQTNWAFMFILLFL